MKMEYKAIINDKDEITSVDNGIKVLSLEEVVDKLNQLEEQIENQAINIRELSEINRLCFDVIDGFEAYMKLKEKGMIRDEW